MYRRLDALAGLALVVPAIVKSEYLEVFPVVTFQHACHQQSGGMFAELAGNIAGPDFVMMEEARDQAIPAGDLFPVELFGATLLALGRCRTRLASRRVRPPHPAGRDIAADFPRDQAVNSFQSQQYIFW